MGACFSCLGGGQNDEESNSESQQLLGDSQMQYGTHEHRSTSNFDSEDLRRQRDNLERLCQDASSRLIDVAQIPLHSDTKTINEDARLFSQVFFAHMDPSEIASGFKDLGVVNVAALAQNIEPSPSRGPLILDFKSYSS